MQSFRFEAPRLPPEAAVIRSRVRDFLDEELSRGAFKPATASWVTFDPVFSRRAAQAGFIGLAWPKTYGGHGRTHLERFVVAEEMLAAGAPAGAHWVADRQSGPQIYKHGTERARVEILPKIARGECFFGIGMSEPNSGSDLASVRTRADKVDGGWRVNGSKIWTSNAHRVQYIIALVRTDPRTEDRHSGLSQLIIDMSSDGIDIRPIQNMRGEHEFNEVFFDDCFVPDHMIIGRPGDGWLHVTEELAHERGGPDRFMSNAALLTSFIDKIGNSPTQRQAIEVGRLVTHLAVLRRMSVSIAALIEAGERPILEAALTKDLGGVFEREVPEMLRQLTPLESALDQEDDLFIQGLAHVTLEAPSYTLRGGTPQVLRSLTARGLGLR